MLLYLEISFVRSTTGIICMYWFPFEHQISGFLSVLHFHSYFFQLDLTMKGKIQLSCTS
jgi:hypothetical protein